MKDKRSATPTPGRTTTPQRYYVVAQETKIVPSGQDLGNNRIYERQIQAIVVGTDGRPVNRVTKGFLQRVQHTTLLKETVAKRHMNYDKQRLSDLVVPRISPLLPRKGYVSTQATSFQDVHGNLLLK